MTRSPIPSSDDLRTQIRVWDPALEEDSKEFEAALVMLAGLYLGTAHGAARKLAEFTGIAYDRVRRYQQRLREAGIWQNGRTIANWDDPRGGETAFWTDVLVAIGKMRLTSRREA